jgi:hypothetical protein
MTVDHVELTDAQAAFVAERIARFAVEQGDSNWLVEYVEKYRILPLYIGWTETIGIMSDGAIRKFSADGDCSEYEGLRVEESSTAVLASLVRGARKYPELQTIIPARPDNAATCEDCAGSGVFEKMPSVICSCGGVGWRTSN